MHIEFLALLACTLQVSTGGDPGGASDGMIVVIEPWASPADVEDGKELMPIAPSGVGAAGQTLHLYGIAGDLTLEERTQMLADVQSTDGVVLAEWNLPASAPDTQRCDQGPSANFLGCTQAFYDGAPSEESYSTQPLLHEIGATFAHRELGNMTVIVAVIDTGVDLAHPALGRRFAAEGYDFLLERGQAWEVANGRDDDLDGFVDEAHGHGTHVSSTITLVNPNARILPLRVLDSDGNGSAYNVARAIHYAVNSRATVINLSLGLSSDSAAVAEALAHARALGVQVVAAAGNTAAQGVLFPARHVSVLAVASVGFDERISPYSTFGGAVSLSAPGAGIYGAMPDGNYAWWSGSSMASAVVAGSLSLTHSMCETFMFSTPAEEVLMGNCRPIDVFNSGHVGLLGVGRVDLRRTAQEIRQN